MKVSHLRMDNCTQGDDGDSQAVEAGMCGVLACSCLDAEPSVIAFDRGRVARALSDVAQVEVPKREVLSRLVESGSVLPIEQDVFVVRYG